MAAANLYISLNWDKSRVYVNTLLTQAQRFVYRTVRSTQAQRFVDVDTFADMSKQINFTSIVYL